MIIKFEVEYLNYREDERRYVYHYRLELSDNFIDKTIVIHRVEVDENDNLTKLVAEIVEKAKSIYGTIF